MLSTVVVLGSFLVIGFFSRKYSGRTRLLMLGSIVLGIAVLIRG